MKIPRFRLTVRHIMVAVAVVAIFLGGGLQAISLLRFSRFYANKAAKFRLDENRWRSWAIQEQKEADDLWDQVYATDSERLATMYAESARSSEGSADRIWGYANEASTLAEKYEHAAYHPWESVVADPSPIPRKRRKLVRPEM